jgi:4-hydroxy-4-methyl-2-oxoglutarate aldolase
MPESETGYEFEALYSGVIYDAMRHDLNYQDSFVVDKAIKPLWPPEQRNLFGHAFTCKGEPVTDADSIDDTVRLRMFRDFTKGCVQVIDAGSDDTCAHFGDISGRLARKFGCVGTVVDGNTRDAKLIERDGFILFCRGIQPIDAYGRWQVVDYQATVQLNGVDGPVTVAPDDYIFADADGVLVIPRLMVRDVCRLATLRLHHENRLRAELDGFDDIQKLHDEIGRW